jgi:excisionase family DNA binding protein
MWLMKAAVAVLDTRTPPSPAATVGIGGPMLTTAEVAHLLGVSRAMVSDLRLSGRLRGTKLGTRAVRFDPADVAAFIAAGRDPDSPERVA